MNSYWPYNMCVILLRSMQTFAGLRDSSLPDTCPSATHYGTTKVTINCQCMEKLNTTQYGKTIWPQCHIGAYVYHDYRPALQAESRSSIWQLSWSVSMNPVNNWIRSNATSKIRMGFTSWPRRHTWLGRSCSQLISWQQLQYVWIETNFNSKSLLTISGTTAICYGLMPHPVSQVYRVYLHIDDTSHAHSAWTTGSDNLRHYNWSYGQNYNFGAVGLLR